ncbi:MAG TPA: RecX family transcriptional regulator [Patescibacteria group bacterium]|jgi:regulatory protein|nr:RecX family transcriptional regulator [Patescibacteria group bacterium]
MFGKSKPLKKPDDADHAYDYALFLLNLSMRTERELREKMEKRGYFPEIINATVTKLYTDRYLDDARYAEVYIESMKRSKYYGSYMMKKKLYEKKVPKDIMEEKLAELLSEEDEEEIATRYVEKNFGALSKVAKLEYDEKQKIMRRLMARGFNLDLAKKLVGV